MRLFPLVPILAIAATGCAQKPMLSAEGGYIRLPANPANPAAAYLTVHGGEAASTLISVTSPFAVRSEMHRGEMSGTMASMHPVERLAVPARGTVMFAPGGLHVMLFTLNPVVKPGGTVPLVLTFADGTRVQIDARAIGAGDPAPK